MPRLRRLICLDCGADYDVDLDGDAFDPHGLACTSPRRHAQAVLVAAGLDPTEVSRALDEADGA